MKTCNNCGRPIEEAEFGPANPVEILAEPFQKSVCPVDDSDLCQACKKELGMLTLMGSGE